MVQQNELEKVMLEDQRKTLEFKEKIANKELKARQKKIEDLQKEVEKLRTAFSKLSTDRGSRAEDDDVVRSKFSKMFEAFEDWSERHAITSFDEVEAELLEDWRNVITESYSDRASNPETGLISKPMWKRGGKILLSSLLGHEVVENIFRHPFFFLKEFDSYGKIQTEPALYSIFKFLERSRSTGIPYVRHCC